MTWPLPQGVQTAGDDAMPLPADRAMPPPGDSESAVAVGGGEIDDLRARRLLVPVSGIDASSLYSTFGDARGAGRRHEAMDILAPRGTPVLAALDGRVVKLFTSAAGGLTIYQLQTTMRRSVTTTPILIATPLI